MLNKYLKTYHFSEYHEIDIHRAAMVIYPLIKRINFKKSALIRLLFTLRGLPQKMDSINGFLEQGFIQLEEKADEEMVIGFLFGITIKETRRVAPD